MKPQLVDRLGVLLLRQGYVVKRLTHTCFDIIARKEGSIFLLKVLEDANAITQADAESMARVSSFLSGTPLIVAEKAGEAMDDNVVYARFGISTLKPRTFELAVENHMPFIRRTQAGLTAQIKGSELRRRRESQNMSLKSLSDRIGVSRRMVTRYEEDGADITVGKAMRLYDLFGADVFEKVNIFSDTEQALGGATSDVARKFEELGFRATVTRKVPFDVIARDRREVILTGIGDKPSSHLQSLAKLIDADNLVIFRKEKPKGIPAMTKKEFLDVERAGELIKFLHDEKYL